MQSILRKAYDAPSDRNPALFQAIFDDIKQKHILFYFTADATQKAAEAINVAGRIHPSDVDYLHINDANLGGAKSNMFTTQEVEQKIDISETGAVTKTVTVAYKNPQEASNCNLEAGQLCLNGVLRNWVRFYVPAGSELVDSAGFQADSVKTSEDMGKMVIEGFFTLDPLSQAKIEITYHIPYRPDATYRLQIQKQPGSKNPEHVIMVGDHREELELTTDQTLELPL
jgi:hypothetical protein